MSFLAWLRLSAPADVCRWLWARLVRLYYLFRPPQQGEWVGKFYKRTGYCNQCAQCCQNIHLVVDNEIVADHETFAKLCQDRPEYNDFIAIDASPKGLVFGCVNLKLDNTCGIYDRRPSFCRSFPTEEAMLNGGKLPSECSYTFTALRSFRQVMQATQPTP
jgi:Fe-S-cluster containining protein